MRTALAFGLLVLAGCSSQAFAPVGVTGPGDSGTAASSDSAIATDAASWEPPTLDTGGDDAEIGAVEAAADAPDAAPADGATDVYDAAGDLAAFEACSKHAPKLQWDAVNHWCEDVSTFAPLKFHCEWSGGRCVPADVLVPVFFVNDSTCSLTAQPLTSDPQPPSTLPVVAMDGPKGRGFYATETITFGTAPTGPRHLYTDEDASTKGVPGTPCHCVLPTCELTDPPYPTPIRGWDPRAPLPVLMFVLY